MKGARSHEELIVWQLANELKLGVYALLKTSRINTDRNLHEQIRNTFDALRDAVDCGYVNQDQIVPLQRLSKRASKAASSLIFYLRTATPPNEPRRPRRRGEPPEPIEQDP